MPPTAREHTPRMFGSRPAGPPPSSPGSPPGPADHRDRDPDRQPGLVHLAEAARDDSGGLIHAVTDREILAAYRILAREEAVFGELASSASVAACWHARQRHPARVPRSLHDHR